MNRPRVVIAAASSLDGKIATAARDPVDFTSRADRARLHALRDAADAILIGAASVRAEDPPLLATAERAEARVSAGRRRQPVRAIVSRTLEVPLGRALKADPDSPVVIFGTGGASPTRLMALGEAGCEVMSLRGEDGVDLEAALAHLYEAHGVRELLCEGGGALNGAMLRAGLIDAVELTVCPLVIGHRDAPTVADGGVSLRDLPAFKLTRCERVEDEVFLTYERS